jgi:peptide/nickel transport system substrate-binding protein
MKLRPGVTFHDGEKFDAAAVKFSLERHLTCPGSPWPELAPIVASVDVVDPLTVKLNLKQPFSPLLAQLTDRAGMMVSPKAAQAAGASSAPSRCARARTSSSSAWPAGPHRVRALPRLLEQGQDPLRQDHLPPIPTPPCGWPTCKSGQLDFIERVAPTDIEKVQATSASSCRAVTELGYQGLTINIAKAKAKANPLGRDARVREAFELSIDRQGLAQVVWTTASSRRATSGWHRTTRITPRPAGAQAQRRRPRRC